MHGCCCYSWYSILLLKGDKLRGSVAYRRLRYWIMFITSDDNRSISCHKSCCCDGLGLPIALDSIPNRYTARSTDQMAWHLSNGVPFFHPPHTLSWEKYTAIFIFDYLSRKMTLTVIEAICIIPSNNIRAFGVCFVHTSRISYTCIMLYYWEKIYIGSMVPLAFTAERPNHRCM